MCGISGIYSFKGELDKNLLSEMNDSLRHRGPDHSSIKIIDNVGFGHCRLSIIDLSQDANQPMSCENDRFTIVFNGEVYNFREIKKQLSINGISFSTSSDTEVVLKAFIKYGCNAFKLFNGMFALAIFDKLKKELILARDQFGIKPLYFHVDNKQIVFSSEKKAILKIKDIPLNINRQALVEYIWFGNPLGNNTFFQSISELGPGTILKISKNKIEKKKFFSINKINQKKISEEDAIKKIKVLFGESVKRHLISDVPVGIFLSGGIDSSAITAYASKYSKSKVKTYSICFDYDKGTNELGLAAKIAKKYRTQHTELKINGKDLIKVLESLDMSHDEPFADAANIPLYLVTKKLKGKIKVILQGDGGDEFFGGYSRYNTIKSRKWKFFSFLPWLIDLIKSDNTKVLRIQRFINAITEKKQYLRNALLLTMESKYSNPNRVFSKSIKNEVQNLDPFKRYKEVYNDYHDEIDDSQALFYTDSQIILKDTFFEKVDKSTMANSIEIRIPFLDKKLSEFALSLPSNLKTKNGIQKYLLKKAFEDELPSDILYGPKKGFGVPYGYWLRTSLSDYFIKQISTEKAAYFIDKKEVLKIFNIHKKEKGNYGFLLWKTLILCIWINKNNIK